MGHEKVHFEPSKEFYKFEGGMKKMSIVFIFLGIIGAVWAFFDNHGMNHHSRFWSNFLLNTYYFNGMAITAIFFVAAHTIGYGGWFVSLKRIFESFGSFIFIGFLFFLIIIVGLWLDWHNLYHHWTHAPATDTIVGDKKAFLNKGMYTLLTFVFFAAWLIGSFLMRRHSLASDHAVDEIAYNQKSKYLSAGYIVGFGVGTSVFSWLAVMSLDPHWYSTLFGWYNFASYMCGFLCMAILVITFLKSKGLLVFVNDSHMHNIVLFLFGFSVFWTYLWFSQFMLIWYGNIPEDTMWFLKRFNVPLFKVIFLLTFVINFVFPFLFLLKRRAKRNPWIYGIAAVILLFGHYLDFYLMVMFEPNAPMHHTAEASSSSHHSNAAKIETKLWANNEVHKAEASHSAISNTMDSIHVDAHTVPTQESVHETTSSDIHSTEVAHTSTHSEHASANHHDAHPQHFATLGLVEIMMFLGFLGLFLFTVLTTLSKERLVPLKSPFLDESLRYHF